MTQIKVLAGCLMMAFLMACGGNASSNKGMTNAQAAENYKPTEYDPERGEGKFNEENLILEDHLDQAMADRGKEISDSKCSACHRMNDERLVGPGWAGVTERNKPYWIMNFITNPDPMIDKDPELQAQLELCLVRMPNQNLTDDDARDILEFMRENDGVK